MNIRRESSCPSLPSALVLLSCTFISQAPCMRRYHANQFSSITLLYYSTAPVDQPAAAPPTSSSGGGEVQPTKCRDPIFALLLIINVAAIAGVAGTYGATAFDQEVNNSGDNYDGYIVVAFILGAIAMVFTGFCLPLMMCIPMVLIKASLIGMLVLSGVMMVISFLSGNLIGGIFGVVFFLIFVCYTKAGAFTWFGLIGCSFPHLQLTFFPLSCFISLVSHSICQCQLAHSVHRGKEKLWRGICGLCLCDRGIRVEHDVVDRTFWCL